MLFPLVSNEGEIGSRKGILFDKRLLREIGRDSKKLLSLGWRQQNAYHSASGNPVLFPFSSYQKLGRL